MKITKQISKYNNSSRNGTKIEYIVIHDTGNYRDTAKDNSSYFNGGDRQASAHYFVDETSIYQVVEENRSSWSCGDGGGKYGITNSNSIGIELCNSGGFISDKTKSNSIELIRDIMNKYNIPLSKVVRHYDASRKYCPSNMSKNEWSDWYKFKEMIQKEKVNYCLEFQKWYNKTTQTKAPILEDGIYGGETKKAYELIGRLIRE